MDILLGAVVEDMQREKAHFLQQSFALADVDKAARNDVGAADHMTVVDVKRRDDDDQAVLSEMLSVAQDDAADVADAESVDKYLAGRNGRDFLHICLVDLDSAADIADKDMLAAHAEKLRELGVLAQMLLLAVNRDEILRTRQAVHDLELLLAGVTGNMYVVHALVDHLAAALEQLVDDVADGLFIAGDRVGGDDDEVALADHHLAVIGIRHARQSAHRLALAAGGD